jgi:hypothetical protein
MKPKEHEGKPSYIVDWQKCACLGATCKVVHQAQTVSAAPEAIALTQRSFE